MIPVSTFNMLIAVDIVLIAYSIIDSRNRLYANIVTIIIAGMLSAFIAAASVADVVYDVVGTTITIMDSPSMWNLFTFISSALFFYAVIMIYEMISEAWEAKQMGKEKSS